MADYLLDSSFLIAYFNEVADRRSGPARNFFVTLPSRSRLFASVVSLAEMLEGSDHPMEVERELTRLVSLLGLHQAHARRAGLMQRRARKTGVRLGENDAWIAATAAMTQLTLVGDDDNAFAHQPGVAYVNFRASIGSL